MKNATFSAFRGMVIGLGLTATCRPTHLISFWAALLLLGLAQQNAMGQHRSPAKHPAAYLIWADPAKCGDQQLSLGLQYQPPGAWAAHLALAANGFYISGIDATVAQVAKHYSGSIIGVQLRFFPWGHRSLVNQSVGRKAWGCYSYARKKTDPLGGLWLAPGYQWERADIKYVFAPDLPTPQPAFTYHIASQSATAHLGYQVRLWHFVVGASYGCSLGQAQRSGDGPDIFSAENALSSALLLRHGMSLEVGIHF